MIVICPYCDIEINEKLIEAEDGCCPECGAVITASNMISGDEEEEEYYDDEYENEYGDEYDDMDDMDDMGDIDDMEDEDYH